MSHTVRRLLGVTGTAAAVGALTVASFAGTATGVAWAAKAPGLHSSIVIARQGQVAQAAAAVTASGGKIGRSLTIVNGFAARLSTAAVASLNHSTSISSVTPDAELSAASDSYDPSTPGASAPATSRATAAWAQGDTGAGVTVAVLDTGVADVPDLHGRLTAGPDFSGEGNSLQDSYGHGTVMAGLIAGDGSSSGGAYPGIAPAAKIISVKVAGRSGATDVSQVLAGLQWIGSFAAKDDIKVVSLAWGSPSDQSSYVDPLDFAVERLWSMGITVVVSAGNSGPGTMTITKPGDDPAVITVGAFADAGTVSSYDDSAPTWSGQGPTADGVAKPDLVSPGRSLIAAASPGSTVVDDNPQALVSGGYIRGSGTSQATAVTAGGVALLLSAHPLLTPDQVKYALKSTAVPISGVATTQQGAGELRISRALTTNPVNAPVQQLDALGVGSLEASRGGQHIETICPGQTTPSEVIGEEDALCGDFDAETWTAETWTAETWTAETWTAETWTAETWAAETWTAETWTAETWTAETWADVSWDPAP